MPCDYCAQQRAKMKRNIEKRLAHVARFLGLKEAARAESANAAPESGDGPKPAAPASGDEPADDTSAAHGKRRVAKAPRGGARS